VSGFFVSKIQYISLLEQGVGSISSSTLVRWRPLAASPFSGIFGRNLASFLQLEEE
jgi:hypothetical protein